MNDSVEIGMYVTFNSDTGIYRVDDDPVKGWVLKQTHRLNLADNTYSEVVNQYYMIYDPAFHLIQTKETLQLNRDRILSKLQLND